MTFDLVLYAIMGLAAIGFISFIVKMIENIGAAIIPIIIIFALIAGFGIMWA